MVLKAFRDEVLLKLVHTGKVCQSSNFGIPENFTSIHKYFSDFYGEVLDIGPE